MPYSAATTVPPPEAQAAILGPSSDIVRYAELYNADGTVWKSIKDTDILGGGVNVDYSRSERRTFELELENIDGVMDPWEGGLWYDKILKIWRGVKWKSYHPNYVEFLNVTRTINVPDNARLDVVGDMQFTFHVSWSDTPFNGVDYQALFGKWDGPANFSYFPFLGGDGTPVLFYSTTGANNLNIVFTKPLFALKNTSMWYRWKIDVNNGAAGSTQTIEYSYDGIAWTLWDTVVGPIISFFSGNAQLRIGTNAPSPQWFRSKLHSLEIRNGLNGPVVLSLNIEDRDVGTGDYVDSAGNAIDFTNLTVQAGYYEDKEWAGQIGEFMLDEIKTSNFPHTVHLQGRDYTKKLILSKFKYATAFQKGLPVEQVLRTIAINGGIDPNKIIMPNSGKVTGKTWVFESGVERWDAFNQIASNYNFEAYFDGNGFLVVRDFEDPLTSATRFTFKTGNSGNLVSYEKTTRDVRIYNVIVVRGGSAQTTPVYGVAENHEPSSPTRIERIGERVFEYESQFITTTQQAQDVADKFLKLHSLEEYDLNLSSIVVPWLEAGDIVEFLDPDPNPGDPTRFLLSNFDIPLSLGAMSATGKRVVLVG